MSRTVALFGAACSGLAAIVFLVSGLFDDRLWLVIGTLFAASAVAQFVAARRPRP